jgi:hypothetical protein
MRDPVAQFHADLELVSGQQFGVAFITWAFEQHPDYVRSTHAAAEKLRSQIQPLRGETGIDAIKAKYRPIVERYRREQAQARKR